MGYDPGGNIRSDPVKSSLGCGWDIYQSEKNKFPKGTSDKYKHCVISCKIRLKCGGFAAGAGGVGKEILDVFGPGNAEWNDLVADFSGIKCAGEIRDNKAENNNGKCAGLTCEKCCKTSGY